MDGMTTLRHRKTDAPLTFNFTFQNKIQRKFTPLYAKKIPSTWRDQTARQLPAYVEARWVSACGVVISRWASPASSMNSCVAPSLVAAWAASAVRSAGVPWVLASPREQMTQCTGRPAAVA